MQISKIIIMSNNDNNKSLLLFPVPGRYSSQFVGIMEFPFTLISVGLAWIWFAYMGKFPDVCLFLLLFYPIYQSDIISWILNLITLKDLLLSNLKFCVDMLPWLMGGKYTISFNFEIMRQGNLKRNLHVLIK